MHLRLVRTMIKITKDKMFLAARTYKSFWKKATVLTSDQPFIKFIAKILIDPGVVS